MIRKGMSYSDTFTKRKRIGFALVSVLLTFGLAFNPQAIAEEKSPAGSVVNTETSDTGNAPVEEVTVENGSGLGQLEVSGPIATENATNQTALHTALEKVTVPANMAGMDKVAPRNASLLNELLAASNVGSGLTKLNGTGSDYEVRAVSPEETLNSDTRLDSTRPADGTIVRPYQVPNLDPLYALNPEFKVSYFGNDQSWVYCGHATKKRPDGNQEYVYKKDVTAEQFWNFIVEDQGNQPPSLHNSDKRQFYDNIRYVMYVTHPSDPFGFLNRFWGGIDRAKAKRDYFAISQYILWRYLSGVNSPWQLTPQARNFHNYITDSGNLAEGLRRMKANHKIPVEIWNTLAINVMVPADNSYQTMLELTGLKYVPLSIEKKVEINRNNAWIDAGVVSNLVGNSIFTFDIICTHPYRSDVSVTDLELMMNEKTTYESLIPSGSSCRVVEKNLPTINALDFVESRFYILSGNSSLELKPGEQFKVDGSETVQFRAVNRYIEPTFSFKVKKTVELPAGMNLPANKTFAIKYMCTNNGVWPNPVRWTVRNLRNGESFTISGLKRNTQCRVREEIVDSRIGNLSPKQSWSVEAATGASGGTNNSGISVGPFGNTINSEERLVRVVGATGSGSTVSTLNLTNAYAGTRKIKISKKLVSNGQVDNSIDRQEFNITYACLHRTDLGAPIIRETLKVQAGTEKEGTMQIPDDYDCRFEETGVVLKPGFESMTASFRVNGIDATIGRTGANPVGRNKAGTNLFLLPSDAPSILEVEVTNTVVERNPDGELVIKKLGGNNRALAGAKFVVKKLNDAGTAPDPTAENIVLTSRAGGTEFTTRLRAGFYVLEEITAGNNAQLLPAPWKFQIARDSNYELKVVVPTQTTRNFVRVATNSPQNWILEVKNMQGVVLPNTGGFGVNDPLLFGGAVTLAGIWAAYRVSRKRK